MKKAIILIFVLFALSAIFVALRAQETGRVMSHISCVTFDKEPGQSYNFGIAVNDFYGSMQVAPQGLGFYGGAVMSKATIGNAELGIIPVGGLQYNKQFLRFDAGIKVYFTPLVDHKFKAVKFGIVAGATFETMELGIAITCNKSKY